MEITKEAKAILYERVGSPFFVAAAFVIFFSFWKIPAAIFLGEQPLQQLHLEVDAYVKSANGDFWPIACRVSWKAFLLTLVGAALNIVFVAILALSSTATRSIRRTLSGYELITRKEKFRLEAELVRLSTEVAAARMARVKAETLRDNAVESLATERETWKKTETSLKERIAPVRSGLYSKGELRRATEDAEVSREILERMVTIQSVVEDLIRALNKTGSVNDRGTNHYLRLLDQVEQAMLLASKNGSVENLLRQIKNLEEPDEGDAERIRQYPEQLRQLATAARDFASSWHSSAEGYLEQLEGQ